jgi:arginase
MRRHAILEAPSILGLRPSGVEDLPASLLGAGLQERVGARHAGRVSPPPWRPGRDPETGILNAPAIRDYSKRLARSVGEVIDRGDFPIVLGGDCSILLGSALALRARGRHGLLFLDGHADFYAPETSPTGEAADMDLALATGRGPELVTTFDDPRPLLRDEDVVAFGHRDAAEVAAHGGRALAETAIVSIDLDQVRALGVDRAVRRGLDVLERPELAGFWIHLDADVLDDDEMPAVDYRMPGGLSLAELGAVLAAAARSPRAIGIEITVFNPRLDPDGTIARKLTACVSSALVAA